MSKVEELHLNPEAFNKMPNLRFMKFYESKYRKKVPKFDSSAWPRISRFLKRENSIDGKKVHGFEKLKSDLSGLRYFCFDGYPDKSLPPNLNPKNLVALYMPNSKVKKLWTGNQDLVNLKYIDLSHSKHLCRIPDLSLMPNLESLNLEDCTNSLKSFLSIRNLHKLVILYLQGCKSLKNLSISDNCQSLRVVNLSNCSNLETVQHLPDTVEKLYLDGTAIKEFPSIRHLFRLVELSLRKCSRLERLPDSIRELKSLIFLYLTGCSKLDGLPNDMGYLQTLMELELEGISFAKIPTFMTRLINLETLSLTRCKMQRQSAFPLVDLSVFQRMRRLCLIDCCIEVLPSNIGQLLSLKSLFLDRNNFETLPESIKDLSNLQELHLSNCQRLKYLSELPSSLKTMIAVNCVSLESISSLPAIFLGMDSSQSFFGKINFFSCSKLKLDITDVLSNVERNADGRYRCKDIYSTLGGTCICYPGCEIPKRFDLKSNESFIKYPKGWVSDNVIGFALCAIISLRDCQQVGTTKGGFRLCGSGGGVSFSYYIESILFDDEILEVEKVIKSDHVFILYEYMTSLVKCLANILNRQCDIEFFVSCSAKNGRV